MWLVVIFLYCVVGVWNLEVGPSKSLLAYRRKMRQISKDIYSAVTPFIAIFLNLKKEWHRFFIWYNNRCRKYHTPKSGSSRSDQHGRRTTQVERWHGGTLLYRSHRRRIYTNRVQRTTNRNVLQRRSCIPRAATTTTTTLSCHLSYGGGGIFGTMFDSYTLDNVTTRGNNTTNSTYR